MTTLHTRAFDAEAFAARLRQAQEDRGATVRAIAEAAGVGGATVHRALRGWPDLSHENYLRLAHWLDAQQERTAA